MPTWFPIGPDFVFTPRDINFKRLSRRNELLRQGLVNSIAIDPNDASTIYTVETPTSGGDGAFRTDDGGSSWTSISSTLQIADPAGANTSCIAHHPSVSGVVYLGTWSGRLYTSSARGGAWSGPFNIGSSVFKIIADPRNATDPTTTVVYAACSNGVWRSPDGGATFTQVLAGNLTTLAARIPTDGSSADFYAGMSGQGILHTTDPTGTWTNLNRVPGSNLPAVIAPTPAQPSGNFDAIRVDVCRSTRRVYAWFFNTFCNSAGTSCNEGNASPTPLYTAADPTGAWTAITTTSPPGPTYGLYDSSFAVAANSPGDGANDILFFGSLTMSRSTDSGRTWVDTGREFLHDDYHAFAFFPDPPPAGVIPATYVGCDGGIAVSTGFADPTFTFPGSFDENDAYTGSGAAQNLNHGKQSTAVYGYNSDPAIAALGYVGVQDTGMNAGDSSLLWRGLDDADGGAVACKPGGDGVKVWYTIDGGTSMITDKGDFSPGWTGVAFGAAGGPGVVGTSNFVGSPDGNCLGGINPQFPTTTIAAAVAAGTQTVTPVSLANIGGGTTLTIDPGGPTQEVVTVSNTVGGTFTATFAQAHGAGVTVQIERRQLGRMDQSGVARALGPDFGTVPVTFVAVSPTSSDIVCFSTSDQRVYLSTNATSASPVFTQITANQPTGASIGTITIDPAGNVFVMLTRSVTTGPSEFPTTGPLFVVTTGGWAQIDCANLPADAASGTGYGWLVADPVQPNTLYAGHDARVFQLTGSGASAQRTWTDISTGLPGQWIYGLWIGNIGTAGSPKVLLRAAVPCHGIWEADVTAGATTPAKWLYMRDNVMDMGWLPSSPDGIANPYNPSNTLYHYISADIKVDALQQGSGGNPDFFQTDPEGSLPLSHVLFDQLRDNSDHLPGADQAMVHVQVRNRATATLGNVRVWALYCNAGAGLHALNESASLGNNYQFWSQFSATGQITPTLPSDSPWHPVGPPIVLPPFDAAHPQVASWTWTVPTLPSGDPGHYCIVAFVHHSNSQVSASGYDVDEITPGNKQIAQKNLHIGPPLPAGGGGSGGGAGGSPGGGAGGRPARRVMREYIEFNNPSAAGRESTFVIDTRPLPPELRVSFMLSNIETVQPLPSSITGVKSAGGPPAGHHLGDLLKRWLDRVEDEIEETSGALLEWAGCWLENLGRRLEHRPLRGCALPTHPPQFQPTVYTTLPSTRVEVTGVLLPPFGSAAALLSIENRGVLPPGSRYTFHVQQVIAGKVVGGSAYVVRIEGDAAATKIIQPNGETEGWVPSYAEDQIATRQQQLGKS